ALIVLAAVTTFLGFAVLTFLPVFAQHVFRGDASTYSHMMAFSGCGSIAGALVVAWLGKFKRMGLTALRPRSICSRNPERRFPHKDRQETFQMLVGFVRSDLARARGRSNDVPGLARNLIWHQSHRCGGHFGSEGTEAGYASRLDPESRGEHIDSDCLPARRVFCRCGSTARSAGVDCAVCSARLWTAG